ncbi:MAG: DUF4249 family protein [Runella slithyformis]|nr:MAG: DUF4249 family protein [Runella slithyformis]
MMLRLLLTFLACLMCFSGTFAQKKRRKTAARTPRQAQVIFADFPLKVSKNNAYLTDQANRPFLMNADAGWLLLQKLTIEEARYYLNNRKAKYFNTVFLQLLPTEPDQKNAYLWKWELFEAQEICITCEKGILNSRTLQCVNASTPFAYDYQCQGNCWELFYSTDINIMSDVFSNGRTITGRRVAQVPYYSDLGALVEVQQYAVSNEAYQYYLLLRDQTQTTGTLADTPPAPIVGNVRNINDRSEIVVGYFGAAGVKKMRYWVNRNGFSQQGGVKTPLLGRATNLEPTTPPAPPTFETRPPLYPCIASRNRTPIRPQGWR